MECEFSNSTIRHSTEMAGPSSADGTNTYNVYASTKMKDDITPTSNLTEPNDIIIDLEKYSKLPTKCKKVAIVGFAPSWVDAPFNDDNFEIWGINELYKYFEKFKDKDGKGARADRWFEIHNPNSPSKKTPEHHAWIQKCGIPVYMWQHFKEFPTSLPYPRNEVKAMINANMISPNNSLECLQASIGAPFSNFSNQITWMILLAIYEGFDEIHVYGVDMATSETITSASGEQIVTGEYFWQRPSCEAVVGFALGKGVKILIPQTSELCKFPQDYGFDTDNQTRIALRKRKLRLIDQSNQMAQDEQQLMAKLKSIGMKRAQIQGAISELSWILGNHIV